MTAQKKVIWAKFPTRINPFNTGTPPKPRYPREVVDAMNKFSVGRRGRLWRHNA